MILITNPQFLPNEADILNALFRHGLPVLHLRKPDATAEAVEALILQVDAGFRSRIMIHDCYELLEKFPLRGIHFTEKTKDRQEEFAHYDCRKSLAIHSLEELKNVKPAINYVFLSPIFPSVSKRGYSKEWDYEEVSQTLSSNRTFGVVALGGITLNNVGKIRELGFDDFALLGSIWERVKAGDSVEQIIEIYKNFEDER